MNEHGNTIEVERRLEASRPVPRAAFRGELRRHLLTQGRVPSTQAGVPSRPRGLKLLITAYAGSGVVLIAIATIGVAGGGPFAA